MTAQHILLLSGPSGAGKSTFREQLAARALPRDIASQLPPGADQWRRMKAVELEHHDPGPGNLIIEYSLTRGLWIEDFRRDPALKILERAASVTVVHFKPSPQRLLQQVSYRTLQRCKVPHYLSLLLKGRFSALPLLARIFSLKRRNAPVVAHKSSVLSEAQEKQRRAAIWMGRYKFDLDILYERWEAGLRSLASTQNNLKQIFLQPDMASVPPDISWSWAVPQSTNRPPTSRRQPLPVRFVDGLLRAAAASAVLAWLDVFPAAGCLPG